MIKKENVLQCIWGKTLIKIILNCNKKKEEIKNKNFLI